MPDNIGLFLLLALLAEVVGTVSGFGSSLLFVPIASFFFDFTSVLAITAVFHIFSNISKLWLFKNGLDRRIAFKLGVPAIVGVIIGALLTAYIPTALMSATMSIVLLALAVYLFLNAKAQWQQNNKNLYGGGLVSGFLAGLVGTGGAIRGITLAAFHLQKDIFIATSALIDLGVDVSRAGIYIAEGYFEMQYLLLIPPLIAVSFLGSFAGKKILKHTSENLFRYLVLGIVALTAIIELIRVINSYA